MILATTSDWSDLVPTTRWVNLPLLSLAAMRITKNQFVWDRNWYLPPISVGFIFDQINRWSVCPLFCDCVQNSGHRQWTTDRFLSPPSTKTSDNRDLLLRKRRSGHTARWPLGIDRRATIWESNPYLLRSAPAFTVIHSFFQAVSKAADPDRCEL